jgi:hypothetical protein
MQQSPHRTNGYQVPRFGEQGELLADEVTWLLRLLREEIALSREEAVKRLIESDNQRQGTRYVRHNRLSSSR